MRELRGGGGAHPVGRIGWRFTEPIAIEEQGEGRDKEGWADTFLNRPQGDVDKNVKERRKNAVKVKV